MKNPSDPPDLLESMQEKLAGLGESSVRKTYYPALQQRIQELERAEAALRQSENFLKNVVQNIPAMVFAKDATDLRFVVVNHAAEELLGYPSEEVLGKTDYDLFPPEQADLFTQYDRLTLERGELVEVFEENITTRSGKDLILHTKKIPLFDETGKARYLLGIAEDITERKKLEQQLLQSQKMEAIGELAGGVAHDFNNILMVIMGFADMLIADCELSGAQKAKITQILEASHRAAQLTSSLLAFSRKQVMKLRTTDLNDIIVHVQKFLARIIGEDIRLKTNIGKGDLSVNVDAGQIEQVLVNLATNARDAMPKGGDLTIESGLQVMDHLFVDANSLGEPGTYAVISVSDTGVGMDEKMRQKIFEPFYTTKEPGKGTGLGLSIVYGIIKQHRGFVNVYSEPGFGTTFRIYLPLAAGAAAFDEEQSEQTAPRGGDETILVAEDDPVLRQLLETILAEYGYHVIVAPDGAEAVERYREAGQVDLVLMDMIMPRLSGKEACDAIRKLNPEARVLYTSGYTRDFMLTRELLDEGTELVMKPVQPQELLKKVREMLDRKHPHEKDPAK